MTATLPPTPSTYAWEPTSEALAAAYGLSPSEIVRFDTNTSPAASDLAQRVLADGPFEPGIWEYPPSDYAPLVAAAAARYGVQPDEVLVGAGADEVLDLVTKASLGPGDTAVIAPPTYAMYRVVTEQRGARIVEVPRGGPEDGYRMNLEGLRAAACRAGLVWLCEPNNPTGTTDGLDRLADLLDGLYADADRDARPAPTVVVDEAYSEFAGFSAIPLLARYPRLIVVRTLSKAYGLAGLRVGFGLARRPVLEPIERYRPPASVSIVSATVGAAVLADPSVADVEVARVRAERERLGVRLGAIGWQVEPSVTNFIVVRFGAAPVAAAMADGLLRRGLVPRSFAAGHPLEACLRLTVRSASENDRLVAAAVELGA